jgi:hypothetical protein
MPKDFCVIACQQNPVIQKPGKVVAILSPKVGAMSRVWPEYRR